MSELQVVGAVPTVGENLPDNRMLAILKSVRARKKAS